MVIPVAGTSLASAQSIGLAHEELLASGLPAPQLWAKAQEMRMCVRSLALNLSIWRRPLQDDVMVSRDSAGRPIHPCAGAVANFWRMFGGSKALDEQGRPVLWYHATDAEEDFTEFARTEDIGFHFGSLQQANTAAARTQEGSERIIPVYLVMRSPLRLPDLHTWSPSSVVQTLRRLGVLSDEVADEALMDVVGLEQVRDWLDAAGYDSIVYRNETEGDGDSVIVFRPEQIKSALGNDGLFDAASPSMVGDPPMNACVSWEDVLARCDDVEHRMQEVPRG